MKITFLSFLIAGALLLAGQGGAQDWPAVSLAPLVSGFSSPVHLTHAGDNSGRLFVVEQAGRIKIVQGGVISGALLDISAQVRSPFNGGGSEEGLLSLAFPPNFAARLAEHGSAPFYIYYTNLAGDNQLSRLWVAAGAEQADPASEEVLLYLAHPTYSNHNGGQLAFGPDGMLYIGTGDGGSGGDPAGNAQNPASLLGKLLRIDVEPSAPPASQERLFLPLLARQAQAGQQTPVMPRYAIPASNPFVGNPAYRPEIWALGLRNPWRFSFDRQSGELWLGDVGQSAWEEINRQPPASQGGQNYGWNILEGNACYLNQGCDPAPYTAPVWVYAHIEGNCSVTGGFRYRGEAYPSLQGIYFYADYCSGNLWGLRFANGAWENSLRLDTPHNISSFGEDQAGELYLLSLGSPGTIYQVISAP